MASCNDNPHEIDVSSIELDLTLNRFEQDLFTCKSPQEIMALKDKYPVFYNVYTRDIMPLIPEFRNPSEEDRAVEFYKYITNIDVDSLYKLASRKFGDFEDYRQDLNTLSKYIYHYFPEHKIDSLVTFVATFKYGSIYIQDYDMFAVGLDMYMGRDFEVYPLLDPQYYPRYRIERFEEQYIVPNAAKSFLYYKLPRGDHETFIDEAVYEGKILYCMDRLLPNTPDSLKIGYAKGMIEWSEANEANIWGYLIENELLFNTDKNDYITKFFNDGPFTAPFGNESPPKAGAWVGWQIVRAYMEKFPEKSLLELLGNKDHQAIFKESGYKP
ncbi:hypothetical protein GYB29_05445 [bacterium]|nr:hypothetical protein [bacterium]